MKQNPGWGLFYQKPISLNHHFPHNLTQISLQTSQNYPLKAEGMIRLQNPFMDLLYT